MRAVPFFVLTLIGQAAFAQIDGQQLFQVNCTACHTIGGGRLVGPDLKDVTEKYEDQWLVSFIRSSQSMINSGDERAVAIANEYNNMPMPDQPFNNEQIAALLDYIKTQSEVAALPAGQPDDRSDKISDDNTLPPDIPKMKVQRRQSEHARWVGRLMLISVIVGFTTAGLILFLTRNR